MSQRCVRLLGLVLGALVVGCGSSAAPPGPPPASDASGAAPATAAPSKPAATTAGPGTQAAATTAPLTPPVAIKIGTLSTVADGPQYLAAERGYFREEG